MSLMFDTAPSTMTAPTSNPTTAPARQLAWELVIDGVWLARDKGRFAGMMQGGEGHPVKLTDEHGNIRGVFDSFSEARKALSS